MTNPLVTAIPDTGNSPAATLRLNLSLSIALPLENAAAVAAFNTWDLATDNTLYPAVVYAGTVYEYDSGDSTTAHDPAAGCITDASGRRYKRALNLKPDHIVIDKDLTAPPASPIEQSQYYVAAAATGAWAGQDKNIATYGRQGWHFTDVEEGHLLYVSDEAVYYHMAASGSLVKGMGNLALADGSIKPIHLLKNFGTPVEAEQNDPPVSIPGDGVAYIVGDTPTGDWAGQASKIAISNGATWDFFTAYEGAKVHDKTLEYLRRYEAGNWVRDITPPGMINPVIIDIFEEAVVIPISTLTTVHVVTIASNPQSTLIFDLRDFTSDSLAAPATFLHLIKLVRDDEVTSILELQGSDNTTSIDGEFWITPADSEPHDYKFQVYHNRGNLNFQINLKAVVRQMNTAQITALDTGV